MPLRRRKFSPRRRVRHARLRKLRAAHATRQPVEALQSGRRFPRRKTADVDQHLPAGRTPTAASPQHAGGAPRPTTVVWTEDLLADELLPAMPAPDDTDRSAGSPNDGEAAPTAEHAAGESPPDLTARSEGAQHTSPQEEPTLREVTAHDLFDAQGNLVLPERSPGPALVGPPPAPAATATPPQPPAEDPFLVTPALTPPVMLPRSRAETLAPVSHLTIASLLKLTLLPFKFCYWPVRISLLRRRQRQLQEQYAQAEPIDQPPATAPPRESWEWRWSRASLSFTAVCVVLLLPLQIAISYQMVGDVQATMVRHTLTAAALLRSGRTHLLALNLGEAEAAFQQAAAAFAQAQAEYRQLPLPTRTVLTLVPVSRRSISAAFTLLEAGGRVAAASGELVNGVETFRRDGNWPQLIAVLTEFHAQLQQALPTVARAKVALRGVEAGAGVAAAPDTPVPMLADLESDLLDTAVLTRSVLKSSGVPRWQRYLVMLQNNAELRATGGFFGSYAILDVEAGQISRLELPAGGTYQLQGSLLALVSSPWPLQMINPRWEFQDANWWPDFATSARKVAWFLEQARGGSVDGVVAITTTFIERLLDVTGPIDLPRYGRTLSAENFSTEIQHIIDAEDDAGGEPKRVLAELTPRILERLERLSRPQRLTLAGVLGQALQEKHLLLYSTDPQTQRILESFGWAGRQEAVLDGDYLQVVLTNISGGKTDRDISTNLRHEVTVDGDGSLVVRLTITRTHHGSHAEEFGGVQNHTYLRVYVPQGSRLVAADGFALPAGAVFTPHEPPLPTDADLKAIEGDHRIEPLSRSEVYDELGKTVFANWLTVRPAQQSTGTFTYRLPFRWSQLQRVYTLRIQKQPGTVGDELLATFRVPPHLQLVKTYPTAGNGPLRFDENVVQFHERLTSDKFYAVMFRATAGRSTSPADRTEPAYGTAAAQTAQAARQP